MATSDLIKMQLKIISMIDKGNTTIDRQVREVMGSGIEGWNLLGALIGLCSKLEDQYYKKMSESIEEEYRMKNEKLELQLIESGVMTRDEVKQCFGNIDNVHKSDS